MDICVYVHVNKIIRCEYNNGGGGGRVKLDKLGGGACPKSLKTPDIEILSITAKGMIWRKIIVE